MLIYMQDMSENVEKVMIHNCQYVDILSIHSVVFDKSS